MHPAQTPTAAPAPTVPSRLPQRLDGTELTHLSPSSYTLFAACPEKWRRRYIEGRRTPASPEMLLGTIIDRAVSELARQRIAGHEPEAGDVIAFYQSDFGAAIDDQKGGVYFTTDLDEPTVRMLGEDGLRHYLDAIDPLAGRPVAVQRELTIRLSPSAQWTILGYLDLEAVYDQPVGITETGEICPPGADECQTLIAEGTRVVEDLKVKGAYIQRPHAEGDIQASTYLAACAIEGQPADGFHYLCLRRPGPRAASWGAKITRTTRSPSQLQAALLRYALMANTIWALYTSRGPEGPWDLAPNPAEFPCGRFCPWHASAPAGAESSRDTTQKRGDDGSSAYT